jgi:hypothetical protein
MEANNGPSARMIPRLDDDVSNLAALGAGRGHRAPITRLGDAMGEGGEGWGPEQCAPSLFSNRFGGREHGREHGRCLLVVVRSYLDLAIRSISQAQYESKGFVKGSDAFI